MMNKRHTPPTPPPMMNFFFFESPAKKHMATPTNIENTRMSEVIQY